MIGSVLHIYNRGGPTPDSKTSKGSDMLRRKEQSRSPPRAHEKKKFITLHQGHIMIAYLNKLKFKIIDDISTTGETAVEGFDATG